MSENEGMQGMKVESKTFDFVKEAGERADERDRKGKLSVKQTRSHTREEQEEGAYDKTL